MGTDSWLNVCLHGRMDGGTDGGMDGWREGGADRWMEGTLVVGRELREGRGGDGEKGGEGIERRAGRGELREWLHEG